MLKMLLFVSGVISFIIGCLIFLVGIGAIVGCAGGIVSLLIGSIISLIGAGAILNYIVNHQNQIRATSKSSNYSNVIDLTKNDNTWVVS